jgi:hypothetical protein
MRLPTIVVLSSLAAMLLSSCNSPANLTEGEFYLIINEIIADDSLYINRVCSKFKNIPLTNDYRKEFTINDLAFIEKQKEIFNNTTVKPNKLKWFKRHRKMFSFTIVDTVCNPGILYHLSFPLISADRQKVLIEFQEDCNCMLGGQGGKALYEKKMGIGHGQKCLTSG